MDHRQRKFKLDDSAIAGMLQLLQVSFMTGTDITDHMRLAEFKIVADDVGDTSYLSMSDQFVTATNRFVEQCVQRLEMNERCEDERDAIER